MKRTRFFSFGRKQDKPRQGAAPLKEKRPEGSSAEGLRPYRSIAEGNALIDREREAERILAHRG